MMDPLELLDRDCKGCGGRLTLKQVRLRAKFCSSHCRPMAVSVVLPHATGTTGAIGELIVSTDLLRRGYAVFRSVSPQCACDLVMMRDGVLLRVEVTTGQQSGAGRLSHSKDMTSGRFDVLAVVTHHTTHSVVTYTPPLAALEVKS